MSPRSPNRKWSPQSLSSSSGCGGERNDTDDQRSTGDGGNAVVPRVCGLCPAHGDGRAAPATSEYGDCDLVERRCRSQVSRSFAGWMQIGSWLEFPIRSRPVFDTACRRNPRALFGTAPQWSRKLGVGGITVGLIASSPTRPQTASSKALLPGLDRYYHPIGKFGLLNPAYASIDF